MVLESRSRRGCSPPFVGGRGAGAGRPRRRADRLAAAGRQRPGRVPCARAPGPDGFPVVAVTGGALETGRSRAEDCPAMVTLCSKPADPDAILAGIREATIIGLERRLGCGGAGEAVCGEDQPLHATPREYRADAESCAACRGRSGDSRHIDDRTTTRVTWRPAVRRDNSLATTRMTGTTLSSGVYAAPQYAGRAGSLAALIEAGTQEAARPAAAPRGRAVDARLCRTRQHRRPGGISAPIAESPDMPASLSGR